MGFFSGLIGLMPYLDWIMVAVTLISSVSSKKMHILNKILNESFLSAFRITMAHHRRKFGHVQCVFAGEIFCCCLKSMNGKNEVFGLKIEF